MRSIKKICLVAENDKRKSSCVSLQAMLHMEDDDPVFASNNVIGMNKILEKSHPTEAAAVEDHS